MPDGGIREHVNGRVAAWEPPHRIVLDGGEGVDWLAFVWLVEARDGGSCVVRRVNTGFGTGAEWDAQYDGMVKGWGLFLRNLQLHLEHFRGQAGIPILPMAPLAGAAGEGWQRVTASLGWPRRDSLRPWRRIGSGGSGSSARHARKWPAGESGNQCQPQAQSRTRVKASATRPARPSHRTTSTERRRTASPPAWPSGRIARSMPPAAHPAASR